jgi:hypothetical protein
MEVRLLASRTSRSLSPGSFLALIPVRGWVDLRAILRLEGSYNVFIRIFILRFCPMIRRGHVNILVYLFFSMFIYRATSLLTFSRTSVLYFVVFILSPNKFTSTWSRSCRVPFHSKFFWFSSTFLMTYSRTDQKSRNRTPFSLSFSFYISLLIPNIH